MTRIYDQDAILEVADPIAEPYIDPMYLYT